MKKTMKKLVSVALVLALLVIPFSTLLNVKALDITTTDAGVVSNVMPTFNVTGVGKGDQLGAYKILDALYDKTSNVISYQFTKLFTDFQASSEFGSDFTNLTVDDYIKFGSADISTEETARFQLLYTQFAKYIKSFQTSPEYVAISAAADTETAIASNITVGSYLILPISTSGIYQPMIANIEIKANNGVWELDALYSVEAKYSELDEVFPDSGEVTGGGNSAKSIISRELGTASVVQGEEYDYIVHIPLPTYPVNASNTTLRVTETLDKGIEFIGFDKMRISDGDYSEAAAVKGTADGKFIKNGNTIATATLTNKEDGTTEITIVFDYKELTSTSVEIHYTAALAMNTETDKIVFGNPYRSKSVLTYSVDPYGNATKTTGASVADALTYGLKVNNIKKDDDTTKLVGAKFALYKVDSEGNRTGDPIAEAEYDRDNNIILFDRGIAATSSGTTYTLVQTAAPAGYTVAPARNIVLNTGATTVDETDGRTYYVAADKTFITTVANSTAGLLPATGGLGTILYTLIGLFIITFSATAVVYYRKKKTATNE